MKIQITAKDLGEIFKNQARILRAVKDEKYQPQSIKSEYDDLGEMLEKIAEALLI